MTSEKESVAEDTNMTDYANLAFNPYAISTDDLTFKTFGDGKSPNNDGSSDNGEFKLSPYAVSIEDLTYESDEPIKDGKSMANGGFEPSPYAISTSDLSDPNMKLGHSMENRGFVPEGFVENNPHYEDTLEVAKKAGLNHTGRRRKENIVYESAGYKKKPKSEKRPEPPKLRATNIPPRQTENCSGIEQNKRTKWKLPFLILCLLLLVCLVGAALGVLAYFDKKECSCNSPQAQQLNQESNSSRLVDIENEFTKNIRDIFARLDNLNAALTMLESKQQLHDDEFTQVKADVDNIHGQLNGAIQTVNSTFNSKLSRINSNISALSRSVSELRNVSEQMDPQGVGNLSACRVVQKTRRNDLNFREEDKVDVSYHQTEGWKVISATCGSGIGAGALHTVLSQQNGDTYTCTCAGPSNYSVFRTGPAIECIIIYWECPVTT